ncbi:MAG: glycosyltransferase [Myxococcota bacterium]
MTRPVAFLVNRFPNPSETFVADQIRALLEKGFEVEVWSRRSGAGRLPIEWDRPGFTLRRAPRGLSEPLAAVRLGVSGWRELRRHPPSIASAWSVGTRAGAHGDAPDYALVVAHFGPQGLDALDLRRLGRLEGPLAVVFHGFDMSTFIEREGEDVYQELFEEARHLLPISERWRKRLLELGAPAERIGIHRMGVDLQAFDYEPRRWSRGEALRLVSVARLVEKKGLQIAIPAVAELAKEVPDLSWDVIGDGPMKDELAELASRYRAPVVFHGARPHDEVRTRLAAAHLLLAPSLTASTGDQEGIPVALMEAMASGLPIVTTRHSGIPELVRPGTGRMADEGKVDALLAELRAALDDAKYGRWPDILAKARARVAEEFDQAVWNERLFELVRGSA